MAAPRVKGREVQSETNSVVGVGTSVAGMVGLADKGPIGETKLITSFAQYQDIYGGFRSDSFLAHAILGFFQNGGSACFVVRTGHYSNLASGQLDVTDNLKATVNLSDRADSPNNTLKIDALSEGDHGNDLSVQISRASIETSSLPIL